MNNAKSGSPPSFFFDAPPEPVDSAPHWVPSLDMWEADGVMFVRLDLPGVSISDLNLVVRGRMLTVTGKRASGRPPTQGGTFYSEQPYGVFSRLVAMPPGAELARATISFDRGVLELRAPMSQGEPQVH